MSTGICENILNSEKNGTLMRILGFQMDVLASSDQFYPFLAQLADIAFYIAYKPQSIGPVSGGGL